MIELGKKQVLTVKRMKHFGAFVGEAGDENEMNSVLLPAKYLPEETKIGDEIEVFIYRDSSDRLIATTLEPALTLGQTAMLTVKDTGSVGAFLDWGLEKDLLLPFREQTVKPLEPGMRVLAALYMDKSRRLCATMRVYDYLKSESPYQEGDSVKCVIYQFNPRLGAFAAVDGIYHGMFPRGKYHTDLKLGQEIMARVEKVRDDGRLELTAIEPVRKQIQLDGERVLSLLDSYDGVLPFTEKADPQVISRELGLSKAAFKRAVGHLLKEGEIRKDGEKIRKS